MTPNRSTVVLVAATALLAACASDAPSVTAVSAKNDKTGAGARVTVVMRNLNSPRGLAFGPEGALYVAEAGTASLASASCSPVPLQVSCFSGTGSISRLFKGEQRRIISGLPSLFDGSDAGGPSHIDFHGRGNGFVTIGLGKNPAVRATLGTRGGELGTLVRFTPNGAWSVVTDLAAIESTDPAGDGFDSNPYGLLVEPGVRYVTDAGGNSLLKVVKGAVSVVATFSSTPNPPGLPPFSQAVPTQVRRGPDGALYVSTLTGFPFSPGVARIMRVVEGSAPTVYVGGLTQLTDFVFAPDGTLYATQYGITLPPFLPSTPASVVKVSRAGVKTTVTTAVANPTGIAIGRDGALYVSNKGNLPGVGEVLRIVP